MNAFIIAMKKEAQALIDSLDDLACFSALKRTFYTGKFLNEDCVICICGIGKVNAAVCTQYVIDKFSPKRIINFGLAGALGEKIKIGDVLFIDKAVQYDFDLSLINNCEIGKLEEFKSPYFNLKLPKNSKFSAYTLATGDRFNENKQDEFLIYSALKARVRDMEGAAISHCAVLNNLPLYMFKAVSDKVEKDSVKSYFENSSFALKQLEKVLPQIFKEIIDDEKN